MTAEGGRSNRLARPILLAALLVLNAGLIIANLQKQELFPFDATPGDGGPTRPDEASTDTASDAGPDVELGDAGDDDPDNLRSGDDWPGGPPPIPNGGPEPRTATLRPDGTMVLGGSVPNWASAVALGELAAARLPAGSDAVLIEYGWHPDSPLEPSGGVVRFEPPVLFDPGQVGLSSAASAQLDPVAELLVENPTTFAVVVAHVDDLGGSDENVAVALARASAVATDLEAKGVDRRRAVVAVAPEGAGAVDNSTDEGRAFNRRVEIWLENLLEPAAVEPIPPVDGDRVTDDGLADDAVADDRAVGDLAVGDLAWSIERALVAGFDCADPAVGEPVRIGYAADFGLVGARSDIAGSEAVGHLARLINCSGGVAGRPVETLVVDVGGSVVSARATTAELLQWNPDAIIGPGTATAGLRLLQATDGSIPVVFPAVVEPALADPSKASYLVGVDGGAVAAAAAGFAWAQDWRTAAVFSEPGPGSHFASASFTAAFERAGGTVLRSMTLEPGVDDAIAAAIVELAAGSQPDVIFAAMPARRFAELRLRAADAGLTAELINGDPLALADFAATVGADPTGSPDAAEAGAGSDDSDLATLAADLEGTWAISPLPIAAETGGGDANAGGVAATPLVQLDRSFRAATGFGSTNPGAAALAGDAVALIVEAFLQAGQAGSGGPDTVSDVINRGLEVDGVSGSLDYRGGGSPARTLSIGRLVSGRIVSMATVQAG